MPINSRRTLFVLLIVFASIFAVLIASPKEAFTAIGTSLQKRLDKKIATKLSHKPVVAAQSSAPAFSLTGTMKEKRIYHTATLLNNGLVLVTGGDTPSIPTKTAELYDSQTGMWRYTQAAMNVARSGHTATLLQDGRVLIAGGGPETNTAEIYDPATETFTVVKPMNVTRVQHRAILLKDGRVLVVAGSSRSGVGGAYATNAAEIYDPTTGNWSLTDPLPFAVTYHTATLLSDGSVFVAGGYNGFNNDSHVSSVASYNPVTGKWKSMEPMQVRRTYHTATLLTNGKVLIAGGNNTSTTIDSSEIYDPNAGTNGQRTLGNTVKMGGWGSRAVGTKDGNVLLLGGEFISSGGASPTRAAQLFNPITSTFTDVGPMKAARAYATATLLPSGQVLIAGGQEAPGVPLASAELWGTQSGCIPPSITTQPVNQSITAGQTAILTVVASGTAPLTYQWYKGTKGDTSFPVTIQPITSAMFTTGIAGQYWVRVRTSCGLYADSNAASITVSQCNSLNVRLDAQLETVSNGEAKATLTAKVIGSSHFSYQWYQGDKGDKSNLLKRLVETDQNIDTFTTPSLISPIKYWVEVTDACGNAKSIDFLVTLPSKPTRPIKVIAQWGIVNPLADYNILLSWIDLNPKQYGIKRYDIYVRAFDPEIEFPCSQYNVPLIKKCVPRLETKAYGWKKIQSINAPNRLVIFENIISLAKNLGLLVKPGIPGLDFSVKAVNIFGEESDFSEPFAITIDTPSLQQKLPPPSYPIVFVPGWHGSETTWNGTTEKLKYLYNWLDGGVLEFDSRNQPPIRNLGDLKAGTFYKVNFDDKTTTDKNEGLDRVELLADRLGAFVSKVLEKNQTDKVILVAHSAGGIVSRACLQNGGKCAGKIYRLVTYGTPHKGTDLVNTAETTIDRLSTLREYLQNVRNNDAFLRSLATELTLSGVFLKPEDSRAFIDQFDESLFEMSLFINGVLGDLGKDLGPSTLLMTSLNSPCSLPPLPPNGGYVWVTGRWDRLATIFSTAFSLVNRPTEAAIVNSLKQTDLFITAKSQDASSNLCNTGTLILRDPFIHAFITSTDLTNINTNITKSFFAGTAFTEGEDYIAVLKGLGYPVLSITPGSPIGISLAAPDGSFATPDFSGIPGTSLSLTGGIEIPLPLNGEYKIGITKHPDATSAQTFSIEAEANGNKVMLLQDVNVNNIPTDGIKISASGYEGDVAPRPNGNGDSKATIADWTQVGRFTAGLDSPQDGSEFQRADCAPRIDLGDAKLTIADWVQAGRYAAGLDPIVPAGGPTALVANLTSVAHIATQITKEATSSEVRIGQPTFTASTVTLPIELVATGTENAVGFSLVSDPALIFKPVAVLGTDASAASLILNPNEVASGRLGIALGLPAGQTFAAGTKQILRVTFNLANSALGKMTTVSFGNSPVKQEVVDALANTLPATFIGSNVVINNPTPTLTALNPPSALVGDPTFTLGVSGTSFVAGSVVQWNGTNLATSFQSSILLTATVPGSLLTSGGTVNITVFSPAPGGGDSNAISFAIINPTPTITGLSFSTIAAGGRAGTLEVTGNGFVSSSLVAWNGSPRPTRFVSRTRLIVDYVAADIACAGLIRVTIASPAPGGGTSLAQTFSITPTVTNLSPSEVAANGGAFTLTVNGTGFCDTRDRICVNGTPRASTLPNFRGTQIITTITAADISEAKTLQISVISADGIVSNSVPLIIKEPSRYEADVTPRPNGNGDGTVTMADWVQLGRFFVGLDMPAIGSEFQRADCAPRETLGDGRISIVDWVQAGRYAAGLDPVVAAGGPTAPSTSAFLEALIPNPFTLPPEAMRTLRVANASFPRAQIGSLAIQLDALGNENATAFSLNFDPTRLTFVDAKAGSDANGAAVQVNASQAAQGKIGLALALPTGQTLAAGTRTLVTVRFIPAGGEGDVTTSVNFGDQLLRRELADVNAAAVANVTYTNAAITLTGKAVATVSAADYNSGEQAAEAIVSAFGSALAAYTQNASGLPLPISLGGSQVIVRDSQGKEHFAPLFYASPTQINFQLPAAAVEGIATITVFSGAGGTTSGLLMIGKVAPALFTADSSGKGVAAGSVLYINPNNVRQEMPLSRYDTSAKQHVAIPVDLSDPKTQVFLTLYGTGLRRRSSLANVQVKMGNISVPIEYVGAQDAFAGLDQINIRLPSNFPILGEILIELTVDEKQANSVKIQLQ